MNPTYADAEAPRWYLLARRPGWRQLDALSDLVTVDGSVQLASIAPAPPAPTARCALAGCDDIAYVDRDAKQLLISTGDAQVRRHFGPVALSGGVDSPNGESGWGLTD